MVVGFPPALVTPELVMVCREAYQPETWTTVDKDENILVDMSTQEITRTFHTPPFGEMELSTIKECKATWEEDPIKCKKLINQFWLKEKRSSAAKVPQELF